MGASDIAGFFEGRSLLVTGATGLMGKVLLEKLLYSCPKVETVFFLIRPKRGKGIETRIEEMTKLPLFGRVRSQCPERFSKLVGIPGDVTSEGLGISPEDALRLRERVSVVIHGAATLRHEAPLKDAVALNTQGTLRLFTFATTLPRLQVILHMSTAFCHVDVEVMEERMYPPPHDPLDIIEMCQWMDEDALHTVTPKLLFPHPNSYTYSKRLAEAVAASFYPKLPVAIIRPSIVTPAWRDPMPGWVDNLNGPIGILVGGAKGVIRSMLCNGEYTAEVIPVDMAINGVLAIAAHVGSTPQRDKEVPVFNLTQNETNVVSWGEVLARGKKIAYENPFEMMLWYPDGDIRQNKYVHQFYSIFCHWLPAYLIDFLMIIFGQKPFMLRIQQRISDGLEVLQNFTTRQWKFPNKKLLSLREGMSEKDKDVFCLNFEGVEVDPYLTSSILGARTYLLKEDPASLPRCRRNLKILWLLDRMFKLLFLYFLGWMVISYSSTARWVLDSFLGLFDAFPFMRTVKI